MRLCLLFVVTPFLTGFVFLNAQQPKLPATPESPTITFEWNGEAPSIDAKEEFLDGAYADLGDKEFMNRLLTESLNLWNEVPGAYIQLAVNEDPTISADATDERYALIVESTDNLTTAAFAQPNFDEDDPSIIRDCDITIADRSADAKDVAYTLVHEMGHCLGLGHAHTNYNAIMGYARMARDLSLGADDMAGVIFLYPDPAYKGDEVRELVGCGLIGQAGTRGSWPTLLFFLLPVFLAFATNMITVVDGAFWTSGSSNIRAGSTHQ